jgi:multidrug efflux pump subunit AcrA (membrane-fusion protein)
MWRKAHVVLLPLAAGGFAVFALYHLLFAEERRPKLAPPAAPPEASAGVGVAGVGIVEPCSESISVGSARAGIVLEVYHGPDDVGRRVSQNEPLFRVDDRDLKAQLEVQRAKAKAAQAALSRLGDLPRAEEVPPWEAKVEVAEARARDMRDRYERAMQIDRPAIADQEVLQRKFASEEAEQAVRQARTELELLKAGAWQPDIDIAAAALEEAKANLAQIETEIERCLVRAPIEGEILQVRVRVGEYVSAQEQRDLVILGDLSRLHVRVDIDEENIPQFRSDAAARAVVRGDARHSYPLVLARREPYVVPKRMLSGLNTERVDTRVLQLVYRVDGPRDGLFVGQQLDVFLENDAAAANVGAAGANGHVAKR